MKEVTKDMKFISLLLKESWKHFKEEEKLKHFGEYFGVNECFDKEPVWGNRGIPKRLRPRQGSKNDRTWQGFKKLVGK